MTVHVQAGDMPESFRFAFGSEYVLVKEGDMVFISYQKTWTDAQRPIQDSKFYSRTSSVNISKDEAQRIWNAISALDLSIYRHPGNSAFEPTPPDMRHTEQLYINVDGKTIVSWSRGYSFLKPDLRVPLAAIEEELRKIYNKLSAK